MSSPLFILGAPRSYTSLIATMIGQHPCCYGVPELNLFLEETVGELMEALGGYKQIQLHGLLRTVAQLYGGEQSIRSLEMARRWLLRRYECTSAAIYEELCSTVHPLIIVDKSPAYCVQPQSLVRLATTFPDARYIHLLRHPRGQGESIMKVAKGVMAILQDSIDYTTEPPMVDPQILWCRIQDNILTFLKDVPEERQLRVAGEDFLNDVIESLQSICSWLGLDRDASSLAAMLHPEDSVYASLGPVGAHLGNDINFLQSPAYRPGRISVPPLDGPLSWRPDRGVFGLRTVQLARAFGYN